MSDILTNVNTGNTNNATFFSNIISLISSLDTNVSTIDDRVYSIVERLKAINNSINYISADVSQTNLTLHRIASMFTDIYNPSTDFSASIQENNQYIENQQTIINSYNSAGESKTQIYEDSVSGLTSQGGIYDSIGDLSSDLQSNPVTDSVFGVIFNNSFIIKLFLIVLSIGTVGYILYGKR